MPKNVHKDPEYQAKYRSTPEHIARQKQYKQNIKEKKRQILTEAIGDCCSFCGTKENLELDHINPKVGGHHKARGHKGMNTSIRHLTDQLERGNLRWLCHSCHREHTRLQNAAAWKFFIDLPLYEQERLMLEYQQQHPTKH